MDESFSSKVEPHGDMFINKFYSVVDKTPQSITLALQQNLMWFGKDARTIITCGFPQHALGQSHRSIELVSPALSGGLHRTYEITYILQSMEIT